MKKQLIFIGPPACGKGTQTIMLSKKLNMPHVDTGSLIRDVIKNQTEDGVVAKKYIDEGKLVPPEIVAKIIKNRLLQDDCKDGVILDGFPRSLQQAQTLDEMNNTIFKDDNVKMMAIYFEVDQNVLMDRIINRRSCPKCKKIYNLKFAPPKNDGVCDEDGEKLMQRADDTYEIALKRFKTYDEETKPLVEFFEKRNQLYKIDANGKVDEIFEKLLNVVEEN